jgi:hypothetical protein
MEDAGIFYVHLVNLQQFGIFYSQSVYFLVIWYIFSVLVCCSKKNLATLVCEHPPALDTHTHNRKKHTRIPSVKIFFNGKTGRAAVGGGGVHSTAASLLRNVAVSASFLM